MLLIKISTKLCQAKISLLTLENMPILLAFIVNNLKPKQTNQTNCEITTQHLRAC